MATNGAASSERVDVSMDAQPMDPYAYMVYGDYTHEQLRVLASRLSFMAASDTNTICELAGMLNMDKPKLLVLMRAQSRLLLEQLTDENGELS